ncbi:MAG TPA: nuclear transport factor 2 family protein [Thermomicrobiaceae bacterium]|nr:nuclear transport factor 2 family protein [Thermomicrobiaceae bacterium]
MALPAHNLELAFAWLDALRRQDLERLAQLLDPAVTWTAIGQPPDQPPGCANRDAVLAMLRRGFAHHGEATIEALELAASDSHALIGRRNPQLVELNGVPLLGQAFLALTIDRGIITEMRGYAGRDEARRAARLGPATDWH